MKNIYYVLGRSFTFDPRNNSLGGSEQAVVRLSEEWAKFGHNVIVYADPCTIIDEFVLNNVSYKHLQCFRDQPANKNDVIILCRQSGLEEWVHNLRTTKSCKILCIDLQDEVSNENILVKELLKEDNVMFCFKSFDHSKMIKNASETFTCCNGLDICNLNTITYNLKRIRHRFCWTSSYERGLKELLTFSWPKIKQSIPNAELHIFYGFQPWLDFNLVEELKNLFYQDGIFHHGRVSLQEIRDEKLKSFLWLYPCISNSETDCINVRESAYLECIPVVSNASVLKERPGIHVLGDSTTKEFHDLYANEVIRLYLLPEFELDIIRKDLKAEYNVKGLFASWKNVAEKWDYNVFNKKNIRKEQINQMAKNIHFVFGNCFPFSPLSSADSKYLIPEGELLSINVAEGLANQNNYNVTIFADKDCIGNMNDGVFVNKVCYKNIDSLFSLQELEVVILHGYSGIHTWAHLRRLNLPKKMLCVYISGDLSSFNIAFPSSFKILQSDNALFCLYKKNQLLMKFCNQLNEKEICFINALPHLIESTYYNIDYSRMPNSLLEISKQDWLPYNHFMYLRKLKENGFEPKVIYDIGSCVLHWTNKAKELWPNATYILFEGMREAEFLYSGYQYNMGILCDEDNKEIKFYKNVKEPGGNSYYREIGHPDSAKIFPDDGYVIEKGMTLDTIVKQKGFPLPDLIKMDIQGAEKDVLKGGQMVQSNAKHLIVEMQHVNYNDGAPGVNETGSYIESLGWTCCAPKFSVNYADADYGYERG